MENQEVLVALLRDKKDFAILQKEHWYRIPIEHTPRRWPPDLIAFYLPRAFSEDAFSIRYIGKVTQIKQVERQKLFPNEFENQKSTKLYHRIQIEALRPLEKPIPCRLARPVVFIPTTWQKFSHAEELNDLFDDSPLEDVLWEELKHEKIPAERQWPVFPDDLNYRLDFAIFCNQGKIDVETDGDTWHQGKERISQDNRRNNDVETLGWHVLRFNTREIRERRKEFCLPKIKKTITNLDGLINDGCVPRKFIEKKGVSAQQLSLFEEKAAYASDLENEYLD